MSEKITAYDNTVLGEGGYSDAGEIDLSKVLTGEDTTSSLLDAILPGIPLVGLGIKGGKSIPWGALLERVGLKGGKAGWAQAVKAKFPEEVKQLALAVKGKIKDGKMVADPGFKYGAIGKPKPKTVETITPKQVWNNPGTKSTIAKNTQTSSNFGETALGLTAFTALLAAITASEGNDAYGWSDKIASFLRPDPEMGTKEQHDEDMDMIIKTMSPEAKLKYLKQTGQGYPADEGMFLRAEPEDTNEILLELLRQQESQ